MITVVGGLVFVIILFALIWLFCKKFLEIMVLLTR